MATNAVSTTEPESNVLNLLSHLRNRLDEEFNRLQSSLTERKTELLAEINSLEQRFKQSNEAKKNKNILESSKNEILKVVAARFETYKYTLAQLDLDLRILSAQIVEFSNITLQIDSAELMASIDKLGHLSYECKINYDNRKIPFMRYFTDIINDIDFDLGIPTVLALTCDHNDNIYITSYKTNKINVFTADGVFVKSIPAERPIAVCIINNILYVSECRSYTICKMNTDGSSVKRIGAKGTALGQFNSPAGLTTNYNCLFVCDEGNHRLQVFTHELQPVRIIQTDHMQHPADININNNTLYVLNNNKSILVISVEGQLLKHLASIQNYVTTASYFCMDSASNILISDYFGSCIQVFSTSGQLLHTLGKEMRMNTSTDKPYCYNTSSICILSTGVIVTANSYNGTIQSF